MRLEVKTDKGKFSDYFSEIFLVTVTFFLGILFIFSVNNLRKISRYYQTKFLCNLVLIEKSSRDFKKLGKIINFTNKQKIWDFCKALSR